MASFLDDEGYILSNILSFIKLDHIYATARVNQLWHRTISKGYFLSQVFNVDDILADESFCSYGEALRNNFGALKPRPNTIHDRTFHNMYLDSEAWKRNHLVQLLKCMERNHGSVERVKIIECYDLMRYFKDDVSTIVEQLAVLFPKVSLIRLGLINDWYRTRWYRRSRYEGMFDNECFIEAVVKNFRELKQLFVIGNNFGRSLDTSTTLNLEKYRTINPSLEFVKMEGLNEEKMDYLMNKNLFKSDEELLFLLQKYPWLLNVRICCMNFLWIAVYNSFRESTQYVLEKKPSLVFQSYLHTNQNIGHPLLLAIRQKFDTFTIDLFVEIVENISNKSDQYLDEVLPQLNEYDTLIYTHSSDKLKSDSRLISFQTRYYTEYLRTNLDNNLKANVPNNYMKYYGERYPLHHMCGDAIPLEEFTKHLDSYCNEELTKQAFILDEFGQSVLHHIFFSGRQQSDFLAQKYALLKERVPSVTKLLFQPNSREEVPLELFMKSISTFWCGFGGSTTKTMIEEMLKEDRELAKNVIGKTCTKVKNLSLFFFVSKHYFIPKLDPKEYDELCNWIYHDGKTKHFLSLFVCGVIDAKFVDENGQSLLHKLAATNHSYGCFFKYCIMFGNGIDQQDCNGNTALHLAQRYETACVLRNYGADPNIENKKGEKALGRFMTVGSKHKKVRVEKLVLCEKCLQLFKNESSKGKHMLYCKKKTQKWPVFIEDL